MGTSYMEAIIGESAKESFDPEGSGYDYDTALKYGMKPDPKTGHWSSREPITGQLLKGRQHETWNQLEQGEQGAGYEIYQKDGRYYSRKKEETGTSYEEAIMGRKDVVYNPWEKPVSYREAIVGDEPDVPEVVTPPIEKRGFFDSIKAAFNQEPVTPKEFYSRKGVSAYGLLGVVHPAISAEIGKAGFGPTGTNIKVDEFGIPVDDEGNRYDRPPVRSAFPEFGQQLSTQTYNEPIYSMSEDKKPRTLIRTIFDQFDKWVGNEDVKHISPKAKADAVTKILANEAGIPMHEYTRTNNYLQLAAEGLVTSAIPGIAAIRYDRTGEEPPTPYDVAGYAIQSVSSLAGLILGPFSAAKAIPLFRRYPMAFQTDPVAYRMVSRAFHDFATLGPAGAISSVGPVLESTTFTEAARKIKDGIVEGGVTAGIFGVSAGLFPKEGIQKGARLITGLALLNAHRAIQVGGNPFTNRPLGEVFTDMALDGFFLYKGLPKGTLDIRVKGLDSIVRDITGLDIKEKAIGEIPNELVRKTELAKLDAEKIRINSLIDEFTKKFDGDIAVAEEYARQLERKALEKAMPVVESPEMVKLFKRLEKDKVNTDKIARTDIIRSAAFRLEDGTILEGPSHPDIASTQITVHPDGSQSFNPMMGRAEHGFMTIDGKFVTSKEAGELIKGKKTYVEGEVHLEDLQKYGKTVKLEEEMRKEGTLVNKGEPKVEPKRKIVEPKPTNKRTLSVKEAKAELDPVYDLIGGNKYKGKRKVNIEEHNLQPGEPAEIPPTWHDGVYRHTILRDADGTLSLGRSGSYDSIMMPGQVAGAKSGPLQPGTTLYIVDSGPMPNQISKVRIYRTAPITKELPAGTGTQKQIPIIEKGPKPAEVTKVETIEAEEEMSPEALKRFNKMVDEEEYGSYSDIDYLNEGKPNKVKPIPDVKRGTQSEPIKGIEDTAFYQDKEKATILAIQFKENKKSVETVPEVYVQKLINDVNLAIHGENVDAKLAADALSKMATRIEEFNDPQFFDKVDFEQFKAHVSDAAQWARKVTTPKDDSATRLNVMIPLDKFPDTFKKVFREIFGDGPVKAKDVYRNEKLYDRTGLWLAKDNMWRIELDDSKARLLITDVPSMDGKLLPEVYYHPELYKKLPEFEGVKIKVTYDYTSRTTGAMDSDRKILYLNKYILDVYGPSWTLEQAIKHTVVHETNHFLNDKMGAFKGSNVEEERAKIYAIRLNAIRNEVSTQYGKDMLTNLIKYLLQSRDSTYFVNSQLPLLQDKSVMQNFGMTDSHVAVLNKKVPGFERYRGVPGEMESRVSSFRMELNDEQRKKIYPWKSLDELLKKEGEKEGKDMIRFSNKLYSGLPLDKMAKLVKKGWEALRQDDIKLKDDISDWLMGKTTVMPRPSQVYRGVPKGSGVAKEGTEYVHGTPWGYSAARGGKGAFGDHSSHDVYAIPATKDTKYYRGGSLEGDPLERTRIKNAKGMTWDELMNEAKTLYQNEVLRSNARDRQSGLESNEADLKYIAESVTNDLTRASFETDMRGKDGIWRGQSVPYELDKELPKLRSYDVLESVVEAKRRAGFTDDKIPELGILNRSGRDTSGLGKDESGIIRAYHWSKDKLKGAFDFGRLGETTKGNNPDAVESAKLGAWFTESDTPIAEGLKEKNKVNLTLKNPLVLDNKTVPEVDIMGTPLRDAKTWLMDEVRRAGGGEKLRNELKKKGYDGIVLEDSEFDNKKSYVVFDKDQVSRDTTSKLYSGPDLNEMLKIIKKGTDDFDAYLRKSRGMKSFKPGEAATRFIEEFNRSVIDKSGNIRVDILDKLGDPGYEVVQRMYLQKGSSALAAEYLKQMNKEVYDGWSSEDKLIIDGILLARRMVAIYKSGSKMNFPEDLTPEKSIYYLNSFAKKYGLSPEKAESLLKSADAYETWMQKALKDLLDNGLIAKSEYDELSKHMYRKIELVDIFDKKHVSTVKGTPITVYDSGVEALQKGKKTDIFERSGEIMALEVFNRTYSRIMKNEANKTLLDVARTLPDNEFVRVKINKETKIPIGWHRIFAFEEGKRQAMFISPEMAKEWLANSPETTYKYGQIMRWASLSPVLRTFATGIDWGFALANIPRDIMHIHYATRRFVDGKWKNVYNPLTPIFGVQMGRDMAAVWSDTMNRKGRYLEYIEEGGGMEFLVHQGRLFQRGRHIGGKIEKGQDVLSYFGESSEILTRLAVRERTIRKLAQERSISMEEARKDKKITQEATFVARDYMDFGQGGTVTKAFDNFLPYLNATVQGTRGMIRTFKPGSGSALSSTFKLGQFGLVIAGTTIAAWKFSPDTMEDLQGNVAMDNNLCVPLGDGFGFEDDNGDMRYPFMKVPLDPGQKFFKVFFEASTNKHLGKDFNVDRVVKSLGELSPVGTSTLLPTVSAVLSYTYNKNFWLNKDVWDKTARPLSDPSQEIIPGKTPQAFIDLGKATGLSPERSKNALGEIIPENSMWAALVGMGYEKVFGDQPKSYKEEHLAEVLAKAPIISRFFGITNPYSKHAKSIQSADDAAVLKRFVENSGMDKLVKGNLYEKNVSEEKIYEYAAKFNDKDTYDRLVERYKWEVMIRDLPEKSFWRRMKGLTLEARARVFVDRLNKSNPVQEAKLWNEYGIVSGAGGVVGKEFREEVSKLRALE